MVLLPISGELSVSPAHSKTGPSTIGISKLRDGYVVQIPPHTPGKLRKMNIDESLAGLEKTLEKRNRCQSKETGPSQGTIFAGREY